ncbi:arylamine N-acetyltransferase family protein [Streptomyces decoyicus]
MPEDQQAEGAPDRWDVGELDVDACLRRIGLAGIDCAVPSPELLRALHRAQVTTFSHENIDVVLGRTVTVDVPSIQDKLVRRYRGGNCLELNLLFAALLQQLGFTVTRLAGRVRMGSDVPRPRTHVMLQVDVDGRPWLADVGFGGPGLLDPLLFADGAAAVQDGWAYGLRQAEDGQWVLHTDRDAEGAFDLYSFTREPQHPVDYVVANHYITTHPRSPFTGQLIVQRSLPEERLLLRGTTLVRTSPGGKEWAGKVSAAEVPRLLAEDFAIELEEADADALSALL